MMKNAYTASVMVMAVSVINATTTVEDAEKDRKKLTDAYNLKKDKDKPDLVDGVCQLTRKLPQRPFPPLAFCFRDNEKSCCMHT